MIDFDEFITDINESKNTHMTHIEDRVIYGGVNGTREVYLTRIQRYTKQIKILMMTPLVL